MNIVLGDNEKRKRKEKVCSTDAWTNISKKKRILEYMCICTSFIIGGDLHYIQPSN